MCNIAYRKFGFFFQFPWDGPINGFKNFSVEGENFSPVGVLVKLALHDLARMITLGEPRENSRH